MQNNLVVKEPEEMILMKGGEFSESALKLSAYLIANLKKDKNIYEIHVRDYSKKIDKKITNYNYLYNIAEELAKKQFKMEDRFSKKFAIYNFLSAVEYDDGILKIEFSSLLMKYLIKIKDKYLKYEIQNIISLNSKYSIKLYKILKDNLGQNTRFGKKAELRLSLDEIKEVLEIPRSYNYGNSSGIKKRILEKAKKEFQEHTDIIFDYEEIKTGKKVTHLKFTILPNPKKIGDDCNKKNENHFKNRANFVSLLRKNYSGNGKYFGYKTIEGKNWWLGINNNGLMYATLGEEIKNLNSSESGEIYDLWFKVAQNSDLYKELVSNGVCLKELYQENRELYLDLMEEIILLKEQGII